MSDHHGDPGQSQQQTRPTVPTPNRAASTLQTPVPPDAGQAAFAGQQGSRPTSNPFAGITALGWLWRVAALCAISVVSGLLWLVIKPDGDPSADGTSGDQTQQRTKYEFQMFMREQQAGGCADASTDRIAAYFKQHPCEHLTRALYVTTLPGGEKVLTSVATARMKTAEVASQLEQLTTQSGTGNIADLVSAGEDVPESFPSLQEDLGYASLQQGDLVVIGESAYFEHPERDDEQLKNVTQDALRLGKAQDRGVPR